MICECKTCKHERDICSLVSHCQGVCDRWEPKPITNADRIRSMTDEEIEKWFWWMHKEMMRYIDSRVFVHDWLKQEVKE